MIGAGDAFGRIRSHYLGLLSSGCEGHEKVGWGSMNSQRLRFDVLFGFVELEGVRVLDVGCGLGAMWAYMRERGIHCQYTGWDILPDMIDTAARRYPDVNFRCVNFLDAEAAGETFDVVFLSGALNLPVDGQPEMIVRAVDRLYELSTTASAFNLLSSSADFIEPGEWYATPQRMLDICLKRTRRVVLRHDYMSHDFSLCMYHD